ncbi:MAG: 3'-5' exonuclease [Lentisphaerae bacterium]|nr:3'-5' exonuclease [Lentisphaerota bacterium]
MTNEEWIIVDTETNGVFPPICTVEIAAQRMVGWEPAGDSFRVLLNHDVWIDPGAQAVHDYSREYLRRHGHDPVRAHQAFHAYVGDLPIVAYNISFDWNRVLEPEYQRLGVPVTGRRGFCAMTLARRAISEVRNYRLEQQPGRTRWPSEQGEPPDLLVDPHFAARVDDRNVPAVGAFMNNVAQSRPLLAVWAGPGIDVQLPLAHDAPSAESAASRAL